MGLLSKLFGQKGKVRFEGITAEGEKFDGTVTVECFNVSKE